MPHHRKHNKGSVQSINDAKQRFGAAHEQSMQSINSMHPAVRDASDRAHSDYDNAIANRDDMHISYAAAAKEAMLNGGRTRNDSAYDSDGLQSRGNSFSVPQKLGNDRDHKAYESAKEAMASEGGMVWGATPAAVTKADDDVSMKVEVGSAKTSLNGDSPLESTDLIAAVESAKEAINCHGEGKVTVIPRDAFEVAKEVAANEDFLTEEALEDFPPLPAASVPLPTVADFVADAEETKLNEVEEVKEEIKRKGERLGEKVEEKLEAGEEEMKKEAHSLMESAKETAHDAGEFLSAKAEGAKESVLNAGGYVAQTAVDAKDATLETAHNAGEFVAQKATDAKETVLNAGGYVAQQAVDAKDATAGYIAQKADATLETAHNAGEFVAQKATDAKETVQNAGGYVAQKAVDAKDATADYIAQKADATLESAHNAGEFLSQKAEDAKETVQNAGDYVAQKATDAKESVQSAGEFVAQKAVDAKDATADYIAQKADATLETVVHAGDFIAEKATDAKETVQGAGEYIADKAVEAKDWLADKALGVKESVIGTAEQAKENVEETGEWMAEKAEGVKDEVVETAHNAKEAVKDKADEMKHETRKRSARVSFSEPSAIKQEEQPLLNSEFNSNELKNSGIVEKERFTDRPLLTKKEVRKETIEKRKIVPDQPEEVYESAVEDVTDTEEDLLSEEETGPTVLDTVSNAIDVTKETVVGAAAAVTGLLGDALSSVANVIAPRVSTDSEEEVAPPPMV